jgi:hypothetical protein
MVVPTNRRGCEPRLLCGTLALTRTRQLVSCSADVSLAARRHASSHRLDRRSAVARLLLPDTAGSSSVSSVMTSGLSAAQASISRLGVTCS